MVILDGKGPMCWFHVNMIALVQYFGSNPWHQDFSHYSFVCLFHMYNFCYSLGRVALQCWSVGLVGGGAMAHSFSPDPPWLILFVYMRLRLRRLGNILDNVTMVNLAGHFTFLDTSIFLFFSVFYFL